jgi:sporulation protein YlmC with PRC-barrel domain
MSELPLDAKVICTDGEVGMSTAVVIDPLTKGVTHVVVRMTGGDEVMVPLRHVVSSDRDSITLNCKKIDLAQMAKFKTYQYVQGVAGSHSLPKGEWEAPYVTLDYSGDMREVEAIPEDELAVHRGDPVKATDGQVGVVGELVIDAASGHITHLVLEQGHLFGKQEITVPIDQIDHVADDSVYLSIDKAAVKNLPSMKVKRHYRK